MRKYEVLIKKIADLEQEKEGWMLGIKVTIDSFVKDILDLKEQLKEKDALLEFYKENKVKRKLKGKSRPAFWRG